MIKRSFLALIAALFLSTAPCWGQKAQFDKIMVSGRGFPEAGATITVCSSAGVLIPTTSTLVDGCSPKVTIYTDPTGATTKKNPFLTDGLGNAVFYANPLTNDWYTYSVTGPTVNPGIFIWVPPGNGSMTPCTTVALGAKDIVPQTCAGMWTLQNLTAYKTTNPTLILYPVVSPTQTVPNFYSGDPGSSFQGGGGDNNFDAQGYLNIGAGAISFNLMASLDPVNKGSGPMSDGLVVYLQQKTAEVSNAALETAIKGIYEKFDTVNDGAASLTEGVAGKIIQSATGNMNQGVGISGEIYNNGNGGTIGEADALRAFFSLAGTNTNVYGLKIENLNGQGCTRCFVWGYKGQATNLPTSYLYQTDDLYIGASINTGGTTAYPATPKFTVNGLGRMTRYNNAPLTDGQLLIGDTAAGYPWAATLTQGSGITITNGAHSITIAASGGGGSVTTFSAGILSPLFTTSVANPTTAPALSFALSNAAANTYLGNPTGGSAAPAYTAISACGDSTHALNYTLGTGFGCQAISASGAPSRLEVLGDCVPTNGNAFYKTTSLANNLFFLGHWEFINGVDGHIQCHIHLPPSSPSTSVVLSFAPVTTSSGNVRLQISDACILPTGAGNLDVALTAATAQNVAISTTLFQTFEASFTPSCSTGDDVYEIDIARIGSNGGDTYTNNIALVQAWRQ